MFFFYQTYFLKYKNIFYIFQRHTYTHTSTFIYIYFFKNINRVLISIRYNRKTNSIIIFGWLQILTKNFVKVIIIVSKTRTYNVVLYNQYIISLFYVYVKDHFKLFFFQYCAFHLVSNHRKTYDRQSVIQKNCYIIDFMIKTHYNCFPCCIKFKKKILPHTLNNVKICSFTLHISHSGNTSLFHLLRQTSILKIAHNIFLLNSVTFFSHIFFIIYMYIYFQSHKLTLINKFLNHFSYNDS